MLALTAVLAVGSIAGVVEIRNRAQDKRLNAAISKKLAPFDTRLSVIEAEFRSNGGESLRDRVVRIEEAVKRQ